MEKYNISLVLFTWLTQTSVGLIILRSIYIRISSANDYKKYNTGRYILLTAFIMLVTGLLFSFAHLNYPRHAYNALNNLNRSWMSREILAEIILLFAILVWYIVTLLRIKNKSQIILEAATVVTGIVLIYFMIRTYMLPSLPELNHPGVPLSFIITPILAGAAVIYLFLRNSEQGLALKYKMLLILMFFASFINYIIFNSDLNKLLPVNVLSLFYLAGFLFSIPSLYTTFKNKIVFSDVIFLNLAIICDFLNRINTLTYTNPAL